MILAWLGVATTLVGLALVVLGALMALTEASKRPQAKGGLGDTLTGLAKLADALAKHPVGIRLIFCGIVLVVCGGVMSGASALM